MLSNFSKKFIDEKITDISFTVCNYQHERDVC